MELIKNYVRVLLQCLYIVDIDSTKFQNVDDVPHYNAEAFPVFMSLIVLERIVLWLQGKKLPPLNDGFTSLTLGIFRDIARVLVVGAETFLYIHIYNNYRIYELPWESTLTWIVAAIGVDFCFYWVHRSAHEINLLWSQHQVHHSSEEFSFTTGNRESFFEGWFGSLCYLPMAFFVPPSVFVVHMEFNFMYQFWVHTEMIDHLGPLEFVFNTPSHHRVHHAANKYCLDKNYGGYLIIWDRLFGTFEKERKDEQLIYGLVYPVQSFNPLYLQFFYIGKMAEKFRSVNGFTNKLFAVLKGPGWFPGTPRLGDPNLLPEVKGRVKYQKPISSWMQIFEALHFVVLLCGYHVLANSQGTSVITKFVLGLYILLAFTSIGMVYDNSSWAPHTEFLRTLIFPLYSFISPNFLVANVPGYWLFTVNVFYCFSSVFWLKEIAKKM